ncbi:Type-2 restriction enzyme MjaV [Candidatus Tiddalikarchaeum anstoanum]|nr:Type-2 restriction enzyme MjaV [Candidatus Tiddalikarchaeum anstoanum]
MHTADTKEFIEDSIESSKKLFNFKDIIKEWSGFDVKQADREYKPIIDKIINALKSNLKTLSNTVERKYKGRSNELGNFLDNELIKIINTIKNYNADRPQTSKGGKQSSGYPDIELKAEGKTIYIETKSYQPKTKTSTLRTFYFKPSEEKNVKITESCPHILIGFEVISKGEENKSPFIVKDFTIIDLFDLKVNFKPEFNASNPMMYNNCRKL